MTPTYPRRRVLFRVVLALLASAAAPVAARPEAPAVFCKTYPEAAECLGRIVQCRMCHDSTYPPVWNRYGQAVLAKLSRDALFAEALPDALHAVEADDADADGVANRTEILGGTFPGDASSAWREPAAVSGERNPGYDVGEYDPAFAYRRASVLYCGQSPSYEELAPFRAPGADAAQLRQKLHARLRECLDGRYWREEGLMRLADSRIRPAKNAGKGQQRSLSGAGLDRGRTLMESMALRYGGGMPLPNCNMASGGYIEHGVDSTVPARARHELIASPGLFATGTHGYKGLSGVPAAAGIERARKLREQLDRESVFARTFAQSPRIQAYLQQRRDAVNEFEGLDMIDKLLLLEPGALDPALGLTGSELAGELRGQLPLLEQDDLQAQIGLGFLLAYHGMSASVTIGLRDDATIVNAGVLGTPIAFDFSHSSHRMTQSLMWCRTASLLDTLISLLKTHDYLGDPGLGKMWDRSLIYVATEFGRSKSRPSGSESWGSAHDLNNGSLLISPLIKGNRVYGGVDPKTGLTFGFDPKTGEAQRDRKLFEGDVYSLIAHALDIRFPGRVDFPAVVKG